MQHSDPWMERKVRTVQLEQFFEPCPMIFKELEERKKQLTSQCLQRQQNTRKKYWNFVYFGGGTFNHQQIFAFLRQSRNLTPREKREMSAIFPQFPSYTQKTTLNCMESVHQNSISNRDKRLLPSGRNPDSFGTYPLRTLVHVSGAKTARAWR